MDMTGYTKLFGSILASTIWREDDKTRIVWITLLAMADKDGMAEGSIPGLADLARVSVKDCEEALAKLQSPDKYSRTQDYEGRRIEPTDGGWFVLNHSKYRDKMNVDERRDYLRRKQQEFRDKHRVNKRNDSSTASTHTTASTKTKSRKLVDEPDMLGGGMKTKGTLEECKAFAVAEGMPESDGEIFFYTQEESGWKTNGKPIASWKAKFKTAKLRNWLTSQKNPSPPPSSRVGPDYGGWTPPPGV